MANFINGMRVFSPHAKAPEFVKANLVINCKELVEYMRANHTNGEIKIDIKMAKSGKLYADLNTFKKQNNQAHPFGQGKTYQETFKKDEKEITKEEAPLPDDEDFDISEAVKDIPF